MRRFVVLALPVFLLLGLSIPAMGATQPTGVVNAIDRDGGNSAPGPPLPHQPDGKRALTGFRPDHGRGDSPGSHPDRVADRSVPGGSGLRGLRAG